MLRQLRYSSTIDSEQPRISPSQPVADAIDLDRLEELLPAKKPLKVSSRNILEGQVKRIVKGTVHTEVTLEIVH